MKKFLALLLAVVMVMSMAACGEKTKPTDAPKATDAPTEAPTQAPTEAPAGETEAPTEGSTELELPELTGVAGQYTYRDSVSTLAANWNPHTYQTTDDAYPADFLRVGLYGFVFNDEINPVEGKESFTGYKIIPEMAASEPVDVTEKIKAEYPQFNIPESATSGYAYTIALNPNATWEDGTPINADTYVYSMQQLLNPDLLNYRATDYFAGNFSIAGAEARAYSGLVQYKDNALNGNYAIADLVKNADGQYETADGKKMFIGLDIELDWLSGRTLKYYVDTAGEQYFDLSKWEALVALMTEDGVAPMTDETLDMLKTTVATKDAWGETDGTSLNQYLAWEKVYPEVEYDGTVGLFKSGEYEITLVLGKSLAGFNLLYNLSGNWIVHKDLYEANLKEDNGVWTSTYNTNVETTMSYGPYKLAEYQADKYMRFEKNENWYGYTDGKHQYVDPVDGETYDMYQTTVIDTQVVSEAATRKLMFMAGQLMGYGLQAEDFDQYRNSDYAYATPSETIFFLILNGHKEAIQNREANESFDKATKDIETLTLNSFRRALAVTYDKELFASTVSPARTGGYGIIGKTYIYDPETCEFYRDTDQAKKALCEFYSVDPSQYSSLDEAVNSITGFDPEAAKVLYKEAFDEAIKEGYITDADGDGKSDQVVTIEYSLSADSDFMTKTVGYLNEKMAEVTKGTPFEGKIEFIKSAPYGTEWSTMIKQGMADTVLGGWSGSAMDPFGLTDLYVNPAYQYDAAWFDGSSVTREIEVNGQKITMTLKQWSDALNGATVTVDGVEYNFGDGQADVDTRLNILAAIESAILSTYNYIPMLQDGGMSLLSQQVFYVVEDYNPVMGRGGIAYMKYNYDDAEWADYVKSQGSQLKY